MSKAGLHNHCDTSFLDGRARPIEMATQALTNGDDAIAITDHDEVGGQIAFQEACQAVGVKDVKGTEARWLRDIAASRDAKTKGADASHIVLLAENNVGLSNMWALSSLAYEKRYFYQKPNLDPGLMRRYSEGLWASDGCGLTRFATYVEKGEEELARQEWGTLLDIFGDHFYSELHTYQVISPQTDKDIALNARIRAMNHAKVRFAQEMGVPLVVVNDAHYAQRDQWEEAELVWAMNTFKGDQTGEKGQAANWLMDANEIDYWMDQHGIAASVIAEAMRNSGWIAEQCNAVIEPHLHMPRLHANDAEDIEAFLRSCEKGFLARIANRGLDESVYLDRLEYEGQLICEQGMAGYFNVVADYVNRARDGSYTLDKHNPAPCICGPGRGSAGGSSGDLRAGHHQPGSDQVRPDVRALHQPGPTGQAGHRRGRAEVSPPGHQGVHRQALPRGERLLDRHPKPQWPKAIPARHRQGAQQHAGSHGDPVQRDQ